ncbi:unnamed protein product [Orchesella dallaii]|uniref:Phospholipid scramblase n=1 Tax=Orchesella dallaii TaxID=48710 RepID=A0ABP1S6I2_9HEXA
MDKNSNLSVAQTVSDVPKSKKGADKPKKTGLYPVVSGHSRDGSVCSCQENSVLGLERLAGLDKLLVSQQIRSPNFWIKFQLKNRYRFEDPSGRDIYFAAERNDCCTTCCCGRKRPFSMSIHDARGREVVKLDRPAKCQGCCWLGCRQRINVMIPALQAQVGSVEEVCKCCSTKLLVKNGFGDVVFKIKMPWCNYSICCGDVVFPILSKESKQVVGKITKKWKGCCQECCTDADNFEIEFPKDLNVQMKAVLLGACILLDFMYFESSKCPAGRFLPFKGFPFA